MTPLFACFPVCMTFFALAILAVAVLVLDLANRLPGDYEPTEAKAPADTNGSMGPPPWWVVVLMFVAVLVVMLVLAWYWPE